MARNFYKPPRVSFKTPRIPSAGSNASLYRAMAQLERARERQEKADEKERQRQQKERERMYAENRLNQARQQTEAIEAEIFHLEKLLKSSLEVSSHELNFEKLKSHPQAEPLDLGVLAIAKTFQKPRMSWARRIGQFVSYLWLPGAKASYARHQEERRMKLQQAIRAHQDEEARRQQSIAALQENHAKRWAAAQSEAKKKNADLDLLRAACIEGKPKSLAWYFKNVLEQSVYFSSKFPKRARAVYTAESRLLLVEYQLPTIDVVPDQRSVKYTKSTDSFSSAPFAAAQRNALYKEVVAQLTLRCLHELFDSDVNRHADAIAFNGVICSTDPATGKPISPCVISVRTTRDAFQAISLDKVSPQACVKSLNACVSQSPEELLPIRPIMELNMADPRFVEEQNVLGKLDHRTNLMDLTPFEFESLVTNLFQKMGLETKLTQASRDGGVDCVAFDPRPILGGKVVIQAKRYKNTVGVSAVRDLFGTMQNEGASKGLLITTSGYGQASFDFAEGKPMELLDGANLLYLLKEHAGLEAKIVMPIGPVSGEP